VRTMEPNGTIAAEANIMVQQNFGSIVVV